MVARAKKLDRFNLGEAYERSRKLEKEYPVSFEDLTVGSDKEMSVAHQAAYDSQITGVFFIRLVRSLIGKKEVGPIDL